VGMAGCVIDPVMFDHKQNDIKGAPDWVNRGSTFESTKEGRMFYGVSSASLQGDMALQKSIAEDRARAELAKVLSSYLEVISTEYVGLDRTRVRGIGSDVHERQIEESATLQVNDAIARQIDDAISRQFKEAVSPQFKDEVARQIKEESMHEIRDAIRTQIEFTYEMEEIILHQIKKSVSRQLINTTKNHLAGSKITASWRDVRTNTIWTIAELDMGYIKTRMAAVNDMNNALRKYFDANTDVIFDRLVTEREQEFAFRYK
jgi:hypothetical protein